MRAVDWIDLLHAFDFKQHAVGDDEICPIENFDISSLVENRDWDLATKRNSSSRQLDGEASGVSRLEQPRSQLAMHIERRSDYMR